MTEQNLEQEMDLQSSEIMQDETDFDGFVEEVETDESQKFPNKYAKILHQRNEARKNALEFEEKLRKFGDIEPEKVEEIISQNQEMSQHKIRSEFFENFPEAKNYTQRIEDFMSENPGITYQNAYKIIKFEEFNDKSYQNKQKSGRTAIFGTTPKRLRKISGFKNMDTKQQFDFLQKEFKSGKIVI